MTLFNEFPLYGFIQGSYGIYHSLLTTTLKDVIHLTYEIAPILDMDFFINNYGDRPISSMLVKINTQYDINNLTDSDRNEILTIIATMCVKYTDKWGRLYSAYVETTYNPIENYDATETMSVNGVGTETQHDIFDDTETTKYKNTNTIANNKYAFNSSSPVGTAGETQSAESDENGNTVNRKTNLATGNSSVIERQETPHILTRHGNIGVTTNQQMLESELILRGKYSTFIDIINADILSMLALPIYE